MGRLKLDEIGYWSEIKIDIIKKYAAAYSKIISAKGIFTSCYIDAFFGSGKHIRKRTKETIEGSPIVALGIDTPFDEYYFIDIESDKIDYLKNQVGDRENVHCMVGDANEKLVQDVFPKTKFSDYRRALCVLDPYGLHLDWTVIQAAGDARSIEIFLNFPVADMNRNIFWKDPEGVDERDIMRMTRYWGDETWRDAAYTTEKSLFAWQERTDNETVAEAFRVRLQDVAGFSFVPEPLPMRNNQGGVVYYLFFASHNPTGKKIVGDIFNKYRSRRA